MSLPPVTNQRGKRTSTTYTGFLRNPKRQLVVYHWVGRVCLTFDVRNFWVKCQDGAFQRDIRPLDVFPRRANQRHFLNIFFAEGLKSRWTKVGRFQKQVPQKNWASEVHPKIIRVDGLTATLSMGASESSSCFFLKHQWPGGDRPKSHRTWFMDASWVVASCFFWDGLRSHPKLFPTSRDFWKKKLLGELISVLHLFFSLSDWWFGRFFIFPYIGNFIIPSDEVHHFSEG